MEQIEDKESFLHARAYHMLNTARQIKQELESWKRKLEGTGTNAPDEYDRYQIEALVSERVQRQMETGKG